MTRIEPTAKRIRTYLGGALVADTIDARLVWENPYYPAYWLPQADVRMEFLTPSGRTEGDDRFFTVKAGERVAEDAAWDQPGSDDLAGLIRFGWEAMDAWFEEDEPVIVHPRNPYVRVDILASSRHVQVALDGVVLADTVRPSLLFETGLPVRYYIPQVDLATERLRPSATITRCPYKGTATYWSVDVGGQIEPDLVWTYPAPLPESVKIAGLACFWSERVDITVDGVLQGRPSARRRANPRVLGD